jgi:hypothetical protein
MEENRSNQPIFLNNFNLNDFQRVGDDLTSNDLKTQFLVKPHSFIYDWNVV